MGAHSRQIMALSAHAFSLPDGLDPSLRIGIPSIDAEHAALIALLDRLIAHAGDAPPSASFPDDLDRVGELIAAHFSNEERLLRALGMHRDEVESHTAAHRTIATDYAELKADLLAGQRDRTCVLPEIKAWILGHLVTHDLKIRYYLPIGS